MSGPVFSVIVPTYNRRAYILETLESIWAQTCQDYEILVVDDGSTDGTGELLEAYVRQGRLHYVYQPNQGESAARNHALRLAKGRYYAFLDSDDLFHPEKLEKQAAYLDANPDAGMVHTFFTKFDDSGADLGCRDTSHLTGRVYPRLLLDWSVLLPPSCVAVRASVMQHVGGFDTSLRWGPDLDLWRRITAHYPIGCVPEPLTRMRVHPGNVSADKAGAIASFERYLRKAFADDPTLGPVFQRRVLAKMYANMAHNILASEQADQFGLVRSLSWKALAQWPLQLSAIVGLGGSLISPSARRRLLALWRRNRYKPAQVER